MANTIAIRAAQAADLDPWITLAANAFRDTYGAGYNSADIEDYVARAFTPAAFRAILDDPTSTLLIAEDAAAPAGYAHLRQTPAPACVPGAKPIELVRLYLRKDAIGAGLGAAFMRQAFTLARSNGCDALWLGVEAQNERARRFYARWGFVDVGRKAFMLAGIEYLDPLMAAPVPATA